MATNFVYPNTYSTINNGYGSTVGYGSSPISGSTTTIKSEYLPKREASDFMRDLIGDNCSENDTREIMKILFDKFSQGTTGEAAQPEEDFKISPEVVTALMVFYVEKYA